MQPIKIRKRTHRFNQYKRRNKKFTSKEDHQRAEAVSSKQATVDQLQKDADKSLADQERAQADVDSKFQDLNDAAKRKDALTESKKAQNKTQVSEDEAKAELDNAQKNVDEKQADVDRAQSIYDGVDLDGEKKELDQANAELKENRDRQASAEEDLANNKEYLAKKEAELRKAYSVTEEKETVYDHYKYRLENKPTINVDDKMKQETAKLLSVIEDYFAGKTDEKTYQDALESYEVNIAYGYELNGFHPETYFPDGTPSSGRIEHFMDRSEKNEPIDINNLTKEQTENITNYVVYLINSIRDQLGLTPFVGKLIATNGVQKLAADYANKRLETGIRNNDGEYAINPGDCEKLASDYGLKGFTVHSGGIYGGHNKNMLDLKRTILDDILGDLFSYRRNPPEVNKIWNLLGISQLSKEHPKISETYFVISIDFIRDMDSIYSDCEYESYEYVFVPNILNESGKMVNATNQQKFENSAGKSKMFDPYNEELVTKQFKKAKAEYEQAKEKSDRIGAATISLRSWASIYEHRIEQCKAKVAVSEAKVAKAQKSLELYEKDSSAKLENLNRALGAIHQAQNELSLKQKDYERAKALNDAAKNDVIQKKTSYDDAVKKRKEAEQKLSDLQNADLLYQKVLDAYNKSKAELLKSNQDVDAKLQALKAAENELLNSKKALEDAKRAVADKQNAYDDSKNKAEFDLEVTNQQKSLENAKTMTLTAYNPASNKRSANVKEVKNKTKEMPQMGDKETNVSVLGSFLIMLSGIMGMFGLATKNKES